MRRILESRTRHELCAQPRGPRRQRHVGEHRKPSGGPPDDVTAGGADIDSGCNPSGTAPHTVLMPKQQVQAATASAMDTRRRQAMLMLGKPTVATVARIYIQNIEARNLASRNADKRARMLLPQLRAAHRDRRWRL